MRKLLFAFLLIISFNLYALERIALVIGNAEYLVKKLNNSVKDAKDIVALLEELDFDVTDVYDAEKKEMKPRKNQGVYFLLTFMLVSIFGRSEGRK